MALYHIPQFQAVLVHVHTKEYCTLSLLWHYTIFPSSKLYYLVHVHTKEYTVILYLIPTMALYHIPPYSGNLLKVF